MISFILCMIYTLTVSEFLYLFYFFILYKLFQSKDKKCKHFRKLKHMCVFTK